MSPSSSPPGAALAKTSKAVLITGCSTGIGRATASALVARGYAVYATARRLETLEGLQGVTALRLDVCDESSMRAAVEKIEREHGAVGVLINNAGFGLEGPVEETPIDDVRRQFETNIIGLVRLTQLVLPGMRAQRRGRIVNIGSMGGRFTFPGGTFYHATKHALESISDGLRYEVRPFGIDVVHVQPGVIATEFGTAAVREIPGMGEGPYASFKQTLFDRMYGAYEGGSKKRAASPEAAARVIARAVTARRPHTRYRITAMARALLVVRSLVPDRVWDAMMRSTFPPPRP